MDIIYVKAMSFAEHFSLEKKKISLLAPDCSFGEYEKMQILIDSTIHL
ncbi:MAG TPA: hypothetical protein VE944_00430 [Nostoc sp.]|nr:hypothetical protein [Nostoc sp.]HYX12841.1 hypothetical protein [Nostoc sp.]